MEDFGSHPERNMFAGRGPKIFNLGVEDVQGKNLRTWGRFVIAHNEQLIGLFRLIHEMNFAHCLTGYAMRELENHISFQTI